MSTTMSNSQSLTPQEKITKARTKLILTQPFWGSLSLRLKLYEDKTGTVCPTLATDGVHLFYNPQFVDSLTLEQTIAVVAHEVSHCAYGHMFRRGDREHMPWNAACDKAINPILTDSGFDLPKDCLQPEAAKKGWNAERLYPDELKRYQKQMQKCKDGTCGHQGGPGTGHMGGFCDGVRDLPGKDGRSRATQSEIDSAKNDWNVATIQAAQAAKMAGKLPADLERLIDDLGKPQIDWRDYLRKFITTSITKNDYRMFPPNRRFLSSGLYLPSMRSEEAGEVVVGVDTSGSVGGNELKAAVTEIAAICEDIRPSRVIVIYCDAEVGNVQEFTPDDYPVSAKDFVPSGGGGTIFQPVFDWVAENMEKPPQALVYITDMYPAAWPEDPQEYPVLWCATTDIVGPFGQTVKIQV